MAEAIGVGCGLERRKQCAAFIRAIRDLSSAIGIPESLGDVQEEDLELIAKRAGAEANPLYPVPRIFFREDFIEVIRKVMGKEIAFLAKA
jgi:alcohol dehydrogenase class IV